MAPEELGAIKAPSRLSDTIIETTEEAPKSAAPKEELLSTQYAALARKERALRARAQAQDNALKAKEAEMKAKEDAFKAREAEYASKFIPRDRLSEDPLTVLSELGLTYDQLTNLALNAPKPEDMERNRYNKKIEAELQSIKDAQEQTKKFYEDSQKQQYEQAKRQIRNEAASLIQDNPSYEAIKATRSIGDVVDLIEKTFNADGILLTVEEAANEVEEYLVEEAMKLARLNKIQQKMKPVAQAPQQTAQSRQQPALKTLTNSASSTRPLTAKERAILAFKNELK